MISNDIVIITKEELDNLINVAFQKGVKRGRFEEGMDRAARKVSEENTVWNAAIEVAANAVNNLVPWGPSVRRDAVDYIRRLKRTVP